MDDRLRVLMITSEWPTPSDPHAVPYIVRQAKFLKRAGVEVEVFPFRGAKKLTNYLRAWRRLRRAYDLRNFHLVHGQFGQSGLLALPKRLPLVVSFRGSDILGILGPAGRITPRGRLLRGLCRLVALVADAVIIVSEAQRAHIPSRVEPHLLPSGIDFGLIPEVEPQEARRHLGLSLDKRLVLFVGPLSYGKGYDVARAAIELLQTRMPVELVLGWDMSQQEILMHMRACDALLFPSRQEGSPNVVKEALACGLPIVASPVGDIPVRLRGIEGCEILANWETETVCDALERTLNRGGRVNASEAIGELDEEAITKRLIGIYRSVLTPAAQAPRAHGRGVPS
jgi:teichuronic acid biosynthesis glycosyltransferase TuaC